MADLLRSGNTMLNMACPVCSNPIFRNRDGNTFCPTCNRNVIVINGNSQQDIINKKSEYHYEEQEKGYPLDGQLVLVNSLEEVIVEKIKIISNKLENEDNIQLIDTYTKILLNCIEILNKIQFKK